MKTFIPNFSVSEVICVKCGYRWIAVRPTQTRLKDLECKNCGQGYVIETGETYAGENDETTEAEAK